MKQLYAAAALLLLAACGLKPDYYVMRHLEKAGGDDPGLTLDGSRHADALHDFLEPHFPRAIYVSNTKRAHETAKPIADRLGLTPIQYDLADTNALVSRVRAEPNKPVLIVGHSNTVPEIVRRLGGVELRPMREDEFRQVFLVHHDGATRVRRIAP